MATSVAITGDRPCGQRTHTAKVWDGEFCGAGVTQDRGSAKNAAFVAITESHPMTRATSKTPTGKPLVIAVAGRKGGVGKTTVAGGLASILHAQKQRVLAIDLDPQSNLAFGLGADPNPRGQTTVEFLLQMHPTPQTIAPGFDVFAGNQGLTGQQIQDLHPEDLADLVAHVPYDIVVLDCPPGNERLEFQAIAAADVAFVVLDAHPYAIVGAQRVHKTLQDTHQKGRRGPSPERWAFVMSRLDGRRAADRDLPAFLDKHYPSVKQFPMRQDAALAAASTEGRPVMDACPEARGVEDLKVIAKWVRR